MKYVYFSRNVYALCNLDVVNVIYRPDIQKSKSSFSREIGSPSSAISCETYVHTYVCMYAFIHF